MHIVKTVPYRMFTFSSSMDRPYSSVQCHVCGWLATGGHDADKTYRKADKHKCRKSSFGWLHRAYGVPAWRGMRVEYDGHAGRILSARGAYLMIEFDEPHEYHGKRGIVHPTWRMVYKTPWGEFDFGQAKWGGTF